MVRFRNAGRAIHYRRRGATIDTQNTGAGRSVSVPQSVTRGGVWARVWAFPVRCSVLHSAKRNNAVFGAFRGAGGINTPPHRRGAFFGAFLGRLRGVSDMGRGLCLCIKAKSGSTHRHTGGAGVEYQTRNAGGRGALYL